MFFIIAIIAFIVAVISLIVYLVQMHRTKEKYLGKDAVDKIAHRAAEQAQRKETVITCDYCGCRIDTRTEKVCPQCGASYDTDKEWVNRNQVDPDLMDKKIEEGLKRNKQKVILENAGRMQRVKTLVICLAAFLVFVIAIVAVALSHDTAESNESDGIPDGYEKTAYGFATPLICEDENVRVEWGDIYVQPVTYSKEEEWNYILEVKIHNKTGKKALLVMDLAEANRQCLNSSLLYEHVGTNEEIVRTIMLPYYDFGGDAIKSLSVFDIRFENDDYETLYENKEILHFETDLDYQLEEKKPEGTILYEKNGVTVSALPFDPESNQLILQITNEGMDEFALSTYASLVNGNADKLYMRYCLPSGCQAEADLMDRVYLPEGEELESIQMQLEFQCPADASKNFVTDYLAIPLDAGAQMQSGS